MSLARCLVGRNLALRRNAIEGMACSIGVPVWKLLGDGYECYAAAPDCKGVDGAPGGTHFGAPFSFFLISPNQRCSSCKLIVTCGRTQQPLCHSEGSARLAFHSVLNAKEQPIGSFINANTVARQLLHTETQCSQSTLRASPPPSCTGSCQCQ